MYNRNYLTRLTKWTILTCCKQSQKIARHQENPFGFSQRRLASSEFLTEKEAILFKKVLPEPIRTENFLPKFLSMMTVSILAGGGIAKFVSFWKKFYDEVSEDDGGDVTNYVTDW